MKIKNIEKDKKHITLPIEKCYAKTEKQNEEETILGATVFQHCALVAYVCNELIEKISPIISCKLPKDISYLASLHDIGKVYPGFQYKIYSACNMYPLGTNFRKSNDKEDGYHTSVGYSALKNFDKLAALIANDHHGKSTKKAIDENADIYGGVSWQSMRMELVSSLIKIFPKKTIDITKYDYDLILATIVLSDWIGSSIQNINEEIPLNILKNEARKAVEKTNFSPLEVKRGLSFESIFSFKENALQKKMISMIKKPGIYILEAPMGEGKTEAALYISYKMLELGYSSGLYFALPTRLTSECMVERVKNFVSKIDDKGLVKLIHGGSISPHFFDTNAIDWFSSKKKALLAPYGVGTIDQALMSILRVKHNDLRKFGLTGKVIILDEVHSYDIYTGTLIVELITALRELGATVIILSATLNKYQCSKLIKNDSILNKKMDYPSLLYKTNTSMKLIPLPTEQYKQVIIEKSENTFMSCLSAINAAKNGQQVLWIENTVLEAQEKYKIIKANCEENIEIGLIHSKFIPAQRNINEKKWVKYYGKTSDSRIREKGKILIGTQVLEQSLDIDCDILFTRMAPIDLLLQRIGRLWRHKNHDKFRVKNAICKAILLMEKDSKNTNFPDLKGSSCFVYSRYILARTIELINSGISNIIIPNDIRSLIDNVYSDRKEEGSLKEYKQELEQKNRELKNYALSAQGEYGLINDDENIQTRYSDQIETRLLIAENIKFTSNSLIINFLDGNSIELFNTINDKNQFQKKIWLLEQNIVTTNYHLNKSSDSEILKYISKYLYIKENRDNYFYLAIRDCNKRLKSTYGENLGFSYFDNLGLVKEAN